MEWVEIDTEKCNDCGLCQMVCRKCIFNKEGKISIEGTEQNCNLCGRCVAICPRGAVFHHRMDMKNFLPIDKEAVFTPDNFMNFIRRRRSHRLFREQAVPKAELEMLVEACRYAPTGSNVQDVELLIIQDKERIQRLSDLTVDFFEQMIRDIEGKMAALQSDGQEIPADLAFHAARLDARKRLSVARETGLDPIFHRAPVVMIFHSPILTSTPKDNCVIAAHNAVLTAMTLGLETCYIGLFEAAANIYSPITRDLNLPEGQQVYSVLILGYPKLRYLRTVDRKPIQVRWA